MIRNFFLLIALFATVPAYATKIAVVDFQRARAETTEGKAATARIDSKYQNRMEELKRMQTEIERDYADYQSRAMILSPDAQQEAQRVLMEKERRYQETQMNYQMELQQDQESTFLELTQKVKAVAEAMCKEKGFDLVIDTSVLVYYSDELPDLTDDLVIRYNASK